MTEQTCIRCSRRTVSVIKTDAGPVCYNCYAESRTPAGSKRPRDNVEARIQEEFFRVIPLYFPDLPDRLLFAVPNGGSRHKTEAANLKRQGVKRGISDVILQIPRKGYASLCLEFKTPEGRQSDEQKEYQRQAEHAGNKYVIVRSVSQSLQTVKEYLGEPGFKAICAIETRKGTNTLPVDPFASKNANKRHLRANKTRET